MRACMDVCIAWRIGLNSYWPSATSQLLFLCVFQDLLLSRATLAGVCYLQIFAVFCLFVCLFRFFVICFSSTVRGVSCFTQPSFIYLFFISKQFPLLINRLLKVKATFLTKQTHTPCMQLNRRISFTITPIYQLYTASSVTDFNFVSKHGAETMRLIRDGEKGGGGVEGGMEVGVEGDHTPVATLSPPE